MIELIKLLVPGTWALLATAVACAAVAATASPRTRRPAAYTLGILVAAYVVLGMPWTARALAAGLSMYTPLMRPTQALGARAITVLDGDHQLARVRETARLYRLLQPDKVIVSGDEDLRAAIEATGVPSDRILWERAASTTREQVLAIRYLAAIGGIDRMVLVASPIHLPRAVGAAAAAGLRVVPSAPTPPHPNLPATGPAAIRPSVEALRFSSESLYEYLALVYYRIRGWLSPSVATKAAGLGDTTRRHG